MKYRVVVGGLIEYDGKILLGRKAKGKGPYPDTWHMPGGGVDLETESLVEAVKREIKEETNLEVQSIERIGFDEDREPNSHGEMVHYVFLIFRVTSTTNEAIPGDDIVEVKWFDRSELKNLALTRPSEKIFKELGWI